MNKAAHMLFPFDWGGDINCHKKKNNRGADGETQQ